MGAATLEITVPSTLVFHGSVSGTWTGADRGLAGFFLIVDFNEHSERPPLNAITPVPTSGKFSGVYTWQSTESNNALKLDVGGHSIQAFRDLDSLTPLSSSHIFQVISATSTTHSGLSNLPVSTSRSASSTSKSFVSDLGSVLKYDLRGSTTATSASNQPSAGSHSVESPTISITSDSTSSSSYSVSINTSSPFSPTQTPTPSAQGSHVMSQGSKRNSIIIGSVLGSLTFVGLVTIFGLWRSKWMAQIRRFDKEHLGLTRSESRGAAHPNQQGISPFPLVTEPGYRREKGSAGQEAQQTVQSSQSNLIGNILENVPQQSERAAARDLLQELMASASTRLVELERLRLEMRSADELEDKQPPSYDDLVR
ncbi:hypothetical protein C8J56DRAFT_1057606 [Mycena floridula]|nr:hypothetical protein C8J56DRAFT_1057606 [Mycena floridula]